MPRHAVSSAPHPFRLLWEDRVVAGFESATGLDPWGRLLVNVKDKFVGDVQDSLRAAAFAAAPYRDGGVKQKVTLERGEIVDPAFHVWAGGVPAGETDDSQGRDSIDLMVEVVDLDGELLERYRLQRCSLSTFIGEPGSTGDAAVTLLELGLDGWTWDNPQRPTGPLGMQDAATGRPLARSCWKSALVGGVSGGLIVALALAPRLSERQAPPAAIVRDAPASATGPIVPPKGPRALPGEPGRAPAKPPSAEEPSPASPAVQVQTRPEPPLPEVPLIENQPPVAADDSYEILVSSTLNVGAPGVMNNDFDPEGDPLSATLVSPPSVGKLALHPDGSFSYTPPARYTGLAVFTYQVDTATGMSNLATVSIQVIPA